MKQTLLIFEYSGHPAAQQTRPTFSLLSTNATHLPYCPPLFQHSANEESIEIKDVVRQQVYDEIVYEMMRAIGRNVWKVLETSTNSSMKCVEG